MKRRQLLSLLGLTLVSGCSRAVEDHFMKFKFVSSGQALEDAPIVEQVIRGNSLRPLSPANVSGHRDSQGNLFIEWVRRGRLGAGMISGSDVPLAEEREQYVVEVYNGSTLVRTWRVFADQSQALLWTRLTEGSNGTYTELPFGGLYHADSSTYVSADSVQRIAGDVRVEFSIYDAGSGAVTPPLNFYLMSVNDNEGIPFFWHYASGLLSPEAAIPGVSFNTGDRFMIELTGKEARYYKNYTGGASAPLYISPYAYLGSPYKVRANIDVGPRGFATAMYQNPIGNATYTAVQQVQDFGSTQSSIKVKVAQISAIVGAGKYAEANL